MNSKIVKVITVLLSVFIILYAVVQAVSFFYSPYDAQTVFRATINNSLITDALVVRDEAVIEQDRQGVLRYRIPNGSKVAQQSVIAEKYANEQDMLLQEKIESIDKEIEVLTQAQGKGAAAGATLDSITTQINEAYLELMGLMREGSFDALEEYKRDLQGLIAKKHVIIGKQENYNEQISALKQEQKELQNNITKKPAVIQSPSSGYFAQHVDGLETQYSCTNTDQITYEALQSLAEKKGQSDAGEESQRIGKIIRSFEWKMVIYLDQEDAVALKEGKSVNMLFPTFGDKQYTAIVDEMKTDEGTGKTKVVFACNIMDNNITRMRLEEVEIILSKVTGIQIPKTAVRYEDGVMGVYEKTGRKLYFRQIDKLYENEEYIISRDHEEDDPKHVYVHQYDDIVIEGKGLYDEKPIQ